MPSLNLIRWGGIAAVVAGLIFIAVALFNPQGLAGISSLPGPLATGMFVVALLGQLAAIASLHVLQRDRYGRLGTVGSLVFFVGIACWILLVVLSTLLDDIPVALGAVLAVVGLLAPFIGIELLGVATFRASVLPRWFGVLLIVGLPVSVLLWVVLGVLAWFIAYGVFWGLVGYALLSSGGTQVQRPPRVS